MFLSKHFKGWLIRHLSLLWKILNSTGRLCSRTGFIPSHIFVMKIYVPLHISSYLSSRQLRGVVRENYLRSPKLMEEVGRRLLSPWLVARPVPTKKGRTNSRFSTLVAAFFGASLKLLVAISTPQESYTMDAITGF